MIVLLGAFGFYIFKNLPEIIETLNTTTQAFTSKMMLAFIVGVISYCLIVLNFQRIFKIFGIPKGFLNMFKLDLSSLATGVVVPSLGVSGSLVFIEDADKNGYSKAKAFAGASLFLVTDYLAISILLVMNLLLFWFSGFMRPQVLIPVCLFLILTCLALYVVFLASARKSKARNFILKLMKPFSGIIKKIIKNSYDPHYVTEKILNEFSLITKTVREDPKHYIFAVATALVMHLTRAIALFLVFLALGYQIEPQVLLSGYVVGSVLVVISPTPNGIGFVEGGMVLIFTSLGVPANIAGTATIIYRGFQFWLPFFIGLFFVQQNQLASLKKEMDILKNESK